MQMYLHLITTVSVAIKHVAHTGNTVFTMHFPDTDYCNIMQFMTSVRYASQTYVRGTQLPNLSGLSATRSSLKRSFSGPRIMTGRV